ncbi:phage tail sheath subtilisin-like domain-containing protein [Chengkuizengella axinellae]|uniref:Phage tail sheath subtilisin-like domain-containing protein n=1 Tax=Chengkuizengella axinellae TaxID=3064388 RepID=A0ABT9IW29_9BACL|nr:phage tail sheath subtilisin-like domain-containing protein [Chengkuizengella sp. 2205SS18-9]MDP5273547.1 phage tail sheath subtilisin-like domain-containing protein [Chengkuizengella sp. 2205SS18-9]
MAGGSWDPITDKVRPGVYINFVDAATETIRGGDTGSVALAVKSYSGTATEKTFYSLEGTDAISNAIELFGEGNIKPIQRALKGGAKEVLVYTMPTLIDTAAYDAMYGALDTRSFNVFAFGGEFADEEGSLKTWVQRNRQEGKHFMVVTGSTESIDQEPANGNARSGDLEDDYIVNLIVGGIEEGENISSANEAAYLAGIIAATPINKSITYKKLDLEDVNKRLTNAEIKTALEAGSLVLVHDGEQVVIERGITTSGSKIRKERARQAIQTTLQQNISKMFIGKIDNNVDGQKALISAVKAYFETLANSNVITSNFSVDLSQDFESKGDQVYLDCYVTEVDSMEEIYFSIFA